MSAFGEDALQRKAISHKSSFIIIMDPSQKAWLEERQELMLIQRSNCLESKTIDVETNMGWELGWSSSYSFCTAWAETIQLDGYRPAHMLKLLTKSFFCINLKKVSKCHENINIYFPQVC